MAKESRNTRNANGPSQNAASSSTKPADSGTFEEGQDFIPFVFDNDRFDVGSAERDAAQSSRKSEKGKEKERSPPVPLDVEDATKPKSERRSRGPRSSDEDKGRKRSRERSRERESKRARRRDRGKDRDEGERHRERGRDRERSRERRKERRERSRERRKDRDRDRDRGRDKEREQEHAQDKERDGGSHKRKYDMIFDFDDDTPSGRHRAGIASPKMPWISGIDWDSCNNVAEMLHREVKAFVEWISPTAVEDRVRGMIVSLISKAVTASFPDAKIIPFGSYETKLYLPLGDIDLVILSDSMAYSNKVTVLHALANTLKRAGITSRVSIIAKAKVPIVKFVTNHGRFNVDISINQSNGITSGKMVNGFLQDMHGSGEGGRGSLALRSLVMITKAFLSQRSMNEVFTGGLGSYSIVCLAISFLQMHPKIRRGEIDAEKNLGVLLMEFFELYGCYFNYDEVGISVRDGGTYFSKRQRGWYDFYKSHLLSIEDPADPSNDISRGSYGFAKVRATLAGAYNILTAAAYLQAGLLSARREGRTVQLRSRREPEESSILSNIMVVTQETINHRRLVQELHDSKVLHDLLGVTPEPAVVEAKGADQGRTKPSSSRSKEAAQSVHSAWQAAGADSDDEHHRARLHDAEDNDEEEGRYTIGRKQPPKKRRRTGRVEDAHTVFIPDDDDDEYEEPSWNGYDVAGNDYGNEDGSDNDEELEEPLWNGYGVSEEEGEHDDGKRRHRDGHGDDIGGKPKSSGHSKASGSSRQERRRMYWLSKKGVDDS